MKRTRKVVLSVSILAVLLALVVGRAVVAQDWRTASREPVGLAPSAATTPEAVVQVYGARTVGMRGLFGVHTWVAVKPENADAYTVYEVIGWRLRWSGSAVVVSQRHADARWFGAEPELYADKRGAEAAALIPRIDAAAKSYPHASEYSAWPGPNSNTFVAWITRAVPELGAHLPPTAIGKDYLGDSIVGSAPSGRGGQLSLGGVLALTLSGVEGLELNLLGLTFGIDPLRPALKLPMVGRIGVAPY
ncbi:MAG: DUF3750 domain-containing protein [Betaproteobacteria bacterium]